MEINIYTSNTLSYWSLKRKTNMHFGDAKSRKNLKTILAPYNGKYTVAIRKGNVRICFWDIDTLEGQEALQLIKSYINKVFKNVIIGIEYNGTYDLFKDTHNVNIINL